MIRSHLLLVFLAVAASTACSGPRPEAGSGNEPGAGAGADSQAGGRPGAEAPRVAAGRPDSTVFLVLGEPQEAAMEALYDGRVVRDAQGCLRTEGPSPATVVWPYGFTLEQQGETLEVKDATGRSIGRIGESFRFGGGQVQSGGYTFLPEPVRATAAARCPGDVWIVGDTNLRS